MIIDNDGLRSENERWYRDYLPRILNNQSKHN